MHPIPHQTRRVCALEPRLSPLAHQNATVQPHAHLENGLVRVPKVDLAVQGGGGQLLAVGPPGERQHVMLQGRGAGWGRTRSAELSIVHRSGSKHKRHKLITIRASQVARRGRAAPSPRVRTWCCSASTAPLPLNTSHVRTVLRGVSQHAPQSARSCLLPLPDSLRGCSTCRQHTDGAEQMQEAHSRGLHSPVPGCGSQQGRPRAEAQRNDRPLMRRQHIQQAAGFEGPDKDLERVLAAGAHHLVGGAGREEMNGWQTARCTRTCGRPCGCAADCCGAAHQGRDAQD